MKKVLAILLVCFAVAAAVNAQDKAIGLKFTGGIEISGQMNMGDANRVEANLSYGVGALGLSGYYQWVKDLPKLGTDFKWYYGGGAYVGIGGGFNFGVAAQVGLEYDLQSLIKSVPLQLTADLTPGLNIIGGIRPVIGGGLGIRYRF